MGLDLRKLCSGAKEDFVFINNACASPVVSLVGKLRLNKPFVVGDGRLVNIEFTYFDMTDFDTFPITLKLLSCGGVADAARWQSVYTVRMICF